MSEASPETYFLVKFSIRRGEFLFCEHALGYVKAGDRPAYDQAMDKARNHAMQFYGDEDYCDGDGEGSYYFHNYNTCVSVEWITELDISEFETFHRHGFPKI